MEVSIPPEVVPRWRCVWQAAFTVGRGANLHFSHISHTCKQTDGADILAGRCQGAAVHASYERPHVSGQLLHGP